MLFDKIYDEEVLKRIDFLKNLKIFEGIKKKHLIYILENLQERKYLKGETIFAENDIGRALFIVFSGKVSLYRKDKFEDKNELISEVHPGEFFGEMALLEEMPRTATAMASEETVVFMLFKTKLEHLLFSKPQIGVYLIYHLSRVLSARLRTYMLGEKENA
ncbi:MAG: cyclic nucleotide-binding domain-containing protein [Elusimicrobiota bacterium]